MKKFLKIAAGILVLFVLVAGFAVYLYGPNFNVYLVPPSVEKYVDVALKQMDNGVHAKGAAWAQEKGKVRAKAKGLKNYADTHDVLEEALSVAGGKHSFLLSSEDQKTSGKQVSDPVVERMDSVLYVKLTPIMLASPEENQHYVDVVAKAIDEAHPKGIVLDLMGNTGGDMYPMITAVAPLIPDGKMVAFKNATGNTQDVSLSDGQIMKGLKGSANKLKIPVAVLIDDKTGSSAEITALAFKGLDQVRFFGVPSAGYTSVNSTFTLYDGTMMQLTTGSIVDRTGKEYFNVPIEPDVVTEKPKDEALAWIDSII